MRSGSKLRCTAARGQASEQGQPASEFFYATPAEARDLLAELAGELLEFEEFPEAVEFHQSQNTRTTPNPSSNDRAAVETMV